MTTSKAKLLTLALTSLLCASGATAGAAPNSSLVIYEGELIQATGCCAELPAIAHDHLWCINLTATCAAVTAPTTTIGSTNFTFPDGTTVPTASVEVTAKFNQENIALPKAGNLPAAGDSCLTDYVIRRTELAKHAAWYPVKGLGLTVAGGVVGAGISAAPTLVAIVTAAESAAGGISAVEAAMSGGSQAAGAGAAAGAQSAQDALATISADAALLPAELLTGVEIGGGVALAGYAAWQTTLIIELVKLDHVIDILREARLGGGKHIQQLVKRLHSKGLGNSSLSLLEPDDLVSGYSPLATIHGQMIDAKGNIDGSVKLTIPCSEQDPLAGGCNASASEGAVVARAIESLDRRHAFCDGALSRSGKKASKKLKRNIVASERKIIKALLPYIHTAQAGKGIVATIQAPLIGEKGYADSGMTRLNDGVTFSDLDGSAKDATNRTIKLGGTVIDLTQLR